MRSTLRATLLLLFSAFLTARAQLSGPVDEASKLVKKIILIGDAGELTADMHHPVVEAVEKLVPMDTNTVVIYLGDNIYRHGLPDEVGNTYAYYKAVIDSQANISLHTPGPVFIIPGNHDWMNGKPGGWNAIRRQQQYIDGLHRKNLLFYPKGGCPGPEEFDLGNDVTLVVMDSQWWIHNEAKPGIESDCNAKTELEVLSQLREILARNYRKLVILAMHHPFHSNGVHGNYYGLKQHIFPFTDLKKNAYIPLPVLGSIYPISRGIFGTPEDIAHPRYQALVDQVDEIMKTHPNIIHVAGHEHSLQWIVEDSSRNFIISGSGCKHQRAQSSKRTRFVASTEGFAVLNIFNNRDVQAQFWTSQTAHAPADSLALQYEGLVLNYGKLPETVKVDTTIALPISQDSVLAPASLQYRPLSGFQTFFAGKNYRDEWSEPVVFKTFRLRKEKGGMRVVGAGGGMQTKSLRLMDKDSVEYAMRTIDKDPTSVVPSFLRGSFAQNIVQDMISAGHPYAPLVVPGLAEAARVPHTNPEFYYVPDDYRLGDYRTTFANKIVLLEKRNAGVERGENTRSTHRLFEKMREDNDQVVDQRRVLRARMLDVLIGDWDRHFDQWRWGTMDTGTGKLYFPIPRDRDQVFFNSDGLLIRIAARQALPWMKGFKHKLGNINKLGYNARDFDRIFMNALDRRQWEHEVDTFVTAVTEDVIVESVSKLPPAIYAIDSANITSKLINRRAQLKDRSMQFYRFLARTITILGSNEQEYFTAHGTDTGVLVQVHARRSRQEGGDTNMLIYSRTMDPHDTKEVLMYGFGGDDYFSIDSTVRSSIRFRFVGGNGKDTFNMQGHARNDLYDLSTDANYVVDRRRTHSHFSTDPGVNYYTLPNYQYDVQKFPWVNVGYNPDDGLLLGVGYLRRTYGFRPNPYKTEHRLQSLYSITRQAFQIRYRGTFNNLLTPYDIVVNAAWLNPALTNFFGIGNETVFREDKTIAYYRARYNTVDADVMLRYRPMRVMSMGIGPAFNHYWNRTAISERRVLEDPTGVGLDSASVYQRKTYAGARAFFLVNNVNSSLLPTRGINWITRAEALRGISDNARDVTSLQSHMTIYTTLAQYSRLTGVIRLGGGKIFSKNYEWFQAMGLGQNNFLRGFRKNRFSGNSLLYGSLELRAKIADINSHILPGAFGVLAFDDVGRVYVRNEDSKRWHNSYGGGFYFAPFNQVVIATTLGFSGDKLPVFNLSLGTDLNLIF